MKSVTALALSVAVLLAGFPAGAQDAQRHPYSRPHELRMTMAEDFVGLNLHFASQTVVRYVSQLAMAWLLRVDAKDAYVPELATEVPTTANGGISADGKTIVYHLRHDAKWSDGEPFTAADVAFTTKVVLDPNTNEQNRQGFDRIEKLETPDKYTVVMHLSKPYADIRSIYASDGGLPLLPEHLLKNVPDINKADYNALPVGIGPFAFKAWHRADSLELVANPLYFRGRPKLDRVVYKIIPDRNTTLAQLQTHELDMWIRVPGSYFDRAAAVPGIKTRKNDAFGWGHLDFVVTHPAVSDPVVRRALRMALDRETIRVKIGRGVSTLSETIYGPSHPAHTTTQIPLVPFDLAGANKLLDAAGWKRGPDGIRAKNGVRLALTFGLPSGSPDNDQIVELIRSWWKQIGVELEVRHVAEALYFATYQSGGTVETGKYDVELFGWTTTGFGDPSNIFGCAFTPPKGQNTTWWCNREADRAMAAQMLEYDPAKRRRYTDLIQRKIFEEVPTIVLSIPPAIFAYNDDLKGFDPSVGAPFDDFMNVDI